MLSLQNKWASGALATLFAVLALPCSAQTRYRTLSLSENTVLPVVLETELNSSRSHPGDPIRARVKIEDQDYMGIPYGSRVEGTVREAVPHKGNDPGVLDLKFSRLRTPNGRT